MKHIVFFSGGIGSWMTAKRVIEKHGKEDVVLLFTDTLIEDEDLYRFIKETVAEMGVEFIRLSDGRTPWDVYRDVRFLGNSRLAPCSHHLKQKVADVWIRDNFKPEKQYTESTLDYWEQDEREQAVLYLGIDWTEIHRTKAPMKNWKPYRVEFPMCEQPYMSKDEMLQQLSNLGIEVPRLYKMGFSHNNCGGFCCRAGQGHFANLLKQLPERYAEAELKEEQMREYLNKDVSILVKTVKKSKKQYTLRQLREDIELKKQIDMNDIGGCGCFVSDEYDEESPL